MSQGLGPPTDPGRPRLDLFADLRIEVDGTPVTVTADGGEVLVSLAAPADVLDTVVGLPLPVGLDRRGVRRRLGRWAQAIAAEGIDVVVSGPAGVLVVVGAHAAPGRFGRRLAGTDRIALGPWTAVRGPAVMLARRRAGAAVARLVGAARARRGPRLRREVSGGPLHLG